jgi:hypothetical protein
MKGAAVMQGRDMAVAGAVAVVVQGPEYNVYENVEKHAAAMRPQA